MGGQTKAPSNLNKPPVWAAPGLRLNQVHGLGLVPVQASFIGANLTVADARAPVFFGGGDLGAFEVVFAYIRPSAAVTGHAANGAGIFIRNVGNDGTGTDNLSASAGYSTLSGAEGTMAASAYSEVVIDEDGTAKKYSLEGASEGIEVFMKKLGTGIDLTAITFNVQLWLRMGAPKES